MSDHAREQEFAPLERFGEAFEAAIRSRDAAERRRRRAIRGAAALSAVCIAVPVLLLAGGSTTTFADRAYAAVSGPGIVQWRTEVTFYVDGERTWQRQRIDGWQGLGITHVVRYERRGGRFQLETDTRIAQGKQRIYLAADDHFLTSPVPIPTPAPDADFTRGDPVRAFRDAYRRGKLREVGPGRFALDLIDPAKHNRRGSLRVTYEFDRTSAAVRRIVMVAEPPPGTHASPRTRAVYEIAHYDVLPATPALRDKLELLPHPGAGPTRTDATTRFSILRSGAMPTADTMSALRRLNALKRRASGDQPTVDLSTARLVAPGLVLAAGRAHLCLYTLSDAGVGSTCRTTKQAARRGLGGGTPQRGTDLVVPDDVHAVRAPSPAGGYATFNVRGNYVRLPKLGGRITLLR